ncbi:alpha-amylase family glycosyl hydrolase [Mycoplasma sp. Ms02]|uniref:alpha-amylase family glycosyl hydrolase n=1 Tax=Mycoplasma sp. Ms02 TaxID=353851 RepID=UPI001C8943BC|nr:alpha-amylase family glycosyl hydrolase [Mycoplasma sp. Ms02]QZE12625.1 alpha-amylase [Mycoplasma sp. Ms02]
MTLKLQKEDFYKDFDLKNSYQGNDLGVTFNEGSIKVKLWHPLALNVRLIIFDKNDFDREVQSFEMIKERPVFKVEISNDFEGYYYQFEITHKDGNVTRALDPYAKSMAPFDWQGKEDKVAKGALVNIDSEKAGLKPIKLKKDFTNKSKAIIYEAHVRDFTSLNPKIKNKGTFKGLQEAQIFDYLNELGVTHLQLLPLNSTYTVNELDNKILAKGEGSGWTTNYNWGYDPHNYFTLNGIYSSNPKNPYSRIKEFKELINEAHEKGVGVIMDVVYNHIMTNNILENVLPGYYFRDGAKVKPVSYPPLASERQMVRKLIVDSLVYYAKEFNIDGFRFDLSCFMDSETLEELTKTLQKINPNIVLHGESWPFSDLEYQKSWIKGTTTNDLGFAYFNDSIRNALAGAEHHDDHQYLGLVSKYRPEMFDKYVSSITGGIRDFKQFSELNYKSDSYDCFASSPEMNLTYFACHDGFTLWDKISTSTQNLSFEERLERYRLALVANVVTQGRLLLLAGTELLQSKPNDESGMDSHRSRLSPYKDELSDNPEGNKYMPNTYKTTDFVNGIKWKHLENTNVKKYIFNFTKQLLNFRKNTDAFSLKTSNEVNENLKIETYDRDKGVLIFKIQNKTSNFRLALNFGNEDYEYNYKTDQKLIFDSKINKTKENLSAHSAMILEF